MRVPVFALLVLVLVLVPAAAIADDAAARARAALALSDAARPVVAPAPRPAGPMSYADGYARAVQAGSPLVVWVGMDRGPKVEGVVTATKPDFPGVAGAGVVVGYPSATGQLFVESKLPADATADDVRRAVGNAARKITTPVPAPSGTGKKLDWR